MSEEQLQTPGESTETSDQNVEAESLLAEAVATPETPLWADPDKAKAEIEKLRKENAASRVNAKAKAAEEARNEFAQQIGKVLGLVQDDAPADPEKLTAQLNEQAAAARQARVDLAVFQAATSAGADANALLDSLSFRQKLAEIDPSDHLAVAAAVGDAVQANPVFAGRKVPAPNKAQGASTGQVPSAAEEAERAAASGDVKKAFALKSDQLLSLREKLG